MARYSEKTYSANMAEIERLYNTGEIDKTEATERISAEAARLFRYCRNCTCSYEDANKLFAVIVENPWY